MSITIKSAEEIGKMREACQTAASVLDFIAPHVKPGVTTGELDRLCLEYMTDELKVKSATIGYAPPGYPPFTGAICTSVNHQVCHGIPGDKVLKNGDSLNIDVTIIKDGWHGDTSRRSGPAPTWATSATPSRNMPKPMATAWSGSSAATASARCSTKTRRCCTTASPAPASNCCPA